MIVATFGLAAGLICRPPRWPELGLLASFSIFLIALGVVFDLLWVSLNLRPERALRNVLALRGAADNGVAIILGYGAGSFAVASALRKLVQPGGRKDQG